MYKIGQDKFQMLVQLHERTEFLHVGIEFHNERQCRLLFEPKSNFQLVDI